MLEFILAGQLADLHPPVLTSHGQDEFKFGRSTPTSQTTTTIVMHHGIYIMGCIWQPFWILQEKVGIYFYFRIIRVVNSQLALYSGARCNTPLTPQHP